MRNPTKVWLIIAGSLILTGSILFSIVLSVLTWDFTKLSTVKYETNTHKIVEPFRDISLTSDASDMILALSDDGTCRVVCYEEENAKHSVTLENGVLVVKIENQKSWYDYIGFHFGSPKITVYLPETEYRALLVRGNTGNVEIPTGFTFKSVDISLRTGKITLGASVSETAKIKTGTGNIDVENTSVGSLNLFATTGNVTVSRVTGNGNITVDISTGKACLTDVIGKSVISRGSTGDITLNKVLLKEKFSIERSTGDVKFNCCDAAEIYVKTTTGNVTGNFLSNKVFVTDTDTGSVEVPKTKEGDPCEMITNTGNIKITVMQP